MVNRIAGVTSLSDAKFDEFKWDTEAALKRRARESPSKIGQIDDGALVPVSCVKRKTHRSLPTTINGTASCPQSRL